MSGPRIEQPSSYTGKDADALEQTLLERFGRHSAIAQIVIIYLAASLWAVSSRLADFRQLPIDWHACAIRNLGFQLFGDGLCFALDKIAAPCE